jgi:hypothetical protein
MATKMADEALIRNLRQRWPEELQSFSDKALIKCYNDFALSDEWGNNDEKFPEWFCMLPHYEEVTSKE